MKDFSEIPLVKEFNMDEKSSENKQKNILKFDDISEESEIKKSNKEKNKEKIIKKMSSNIFNNSNNKKILEKNLVIEKQSKNTKINEEGNLDYLLSLCNYDIFSFARHGHYKELEKLFLEGINPDSKDKFGNTLLIISAQNNNKRILKICLRYGAQINMQNIMGNTALHFAKEYGYNDIFEYLIKKGANPEIKNLRGVPAKCGLYNNDDKKLFLGEGLIDGKSKKNVEQNDKYKKYDEKIINKIK